MSSVWHRIFHRSGKKRAAAFVDFEHWCISMQRLYGQKPDVRAWYDMIRQEYDVADVVFFGDFSGIFRKRKEENMRTKNIKDRCTKRKLKKCEEVAKTYDKIQTAYADILDRDPEVNSIRCNVPLDGEDYMTDFLCTKQDGDLMVRECVFRSKLSLPRTCKLLDISREYWQKRGVTDWAIVVEKEDSDAEE